MNAAVTISAAEWNDCREKTWRRIFELFGIPFSAALTSHLAQKDEERQQQKREREEMKAQLQLTRGQIEQILEAEEECEEDSTENAPNYKFTKQNYRTPPLSPQKGTNKKRSNNKGTYGDHGLSS